VRDRASSAEPEQRATKGDHSGVVAYGLLISRSKPTRLFEKVERTLDFRTSLEELLVVRQFLGSTAVRWDHRGAVLLLKGAPEIARIVCLVGKQAARQDPRDEFLGGLAVVTLTFCDLEREWKAEGIDNEVDLRRQPST
jgi:hypothetical protein